MLRCFISVIIWLSLEDVFLWFCRFLTGEPAGVGYAIGLRRDRGVPPPVDPPVGFGLVLVGVFGFLLPFFLNLFFGSLIS